MEISGSNMLRRYDARGYRLKAVNALMRPAGERVPAECPDSSLQRINVMASCTLVSSAGTCREDGIGKTTSYVT
jgi:hypothetical protein